MIRLRARCGRAALMLVAVAAGIAVALFVARPARADESTRNRLMSEINQLLSDMANALSNVPDDTGTSYTDSALAKSEYVFDKATEIKNHADDNSDARRMADYYPDYARRFQDTLRYLREMKTSQRKLDGGARTCEDTRRELEAKMRNYTDSGDPRGIEEIPRLARDSGRIARELLEQAERLRYEMYAWNDRVDDFSASDGKWSDVRANLTSAGNAVYRYVQEKQEQLKRDDVCGNLAKEERNPMVEEAMRKLYEGKKGIEGLYEAMERQLGEIAGALDRLESDSSDSDINTAESKLGELERNLDQLDRVKGNDAEAKRRLDLYRERARSAREAWTKLRVLKLAQFAADLAPQKCRELEARLDEIIKGYTDVQDIDGKTEIPMKARAMAEPIKAGLAKTDQQHPVMASALSDALRFDASEGGWRGVTEKHQASAKAMFKYWESAREAAHKACDDLAKGEDNPTVQRGLAKIKDSASANERDLARLQTDLDRWYADIQELRGWYKQDTAAVRDAFCNMAESPGDSDEGGEYVAKVQQIADRMRDRLAPKWSDITNRAAAMTNAADVLIAKKDNDVKKGAEKVKQRVEQVIRSLTNLMNNELQGGNDPDLRARMETGKNEHKRIQADSSKCTVSEVTFGRRRLDCIRVDGATCYVVEIKPNNQAARDRGDKQINEGIEYVQEALRGKKKRDELTGKLEVLRPCFDESVGEAKLARELRVYEYCPADGELFKDFVVP
jgi:polyhydroxyalkanoate synthesis regulator phasin/phosphopantetheine adenylyltransferase